MSSGRFCEKVTSGLILWLAIQSGGSALHEPQPPSSSPR
jgi:hypothetical protein